MVLQADLLGMKAAVEPAGPPPRWELARLFAECDVVSLHCPLTPETARLVSRERLEAMKPSADVPRCREDNPRGSVGAGATVLSAAALSGAMIVGRRAVVGIEHDSGVN